MSQIKNSLQPLFLFTRNVVYTSLGIVDKNLHNHIKGITILSYHSVSDDSWKFGVDFTTLKKQITYLKEHFEFITLSDVQKYITGKKVLDKPAIVLTFDDGYKDVLKTKEFFKKNNIQPTMFLIADVENINYPELGVKKPFLNKREILSLIKAGWEIGSHSNTHSNLSELSEKEIYDEVVSSKKKLEKWLGIKVNYFAYPRGKYSKYVLDCVKKAGYKLAVTMDDGFISVKSNPIVLPRVGVDRTHSFAEFSSSFSPSVVKFRKVIKNSYFGRYF